MEGWILMKLWILIERLRWIGRMGGDELDGWMGGELDRGWRDFDGGMDWDRKIEMDRIDG